MKPKFAGWNRIRSLFKKSSENKVSESPVPTVETNTHTGTNQAVEGKIHESNPAESGTSSSKVNVDKSKIKKTDSVSTSKSGNATRTRSMGSATKSKGSSSSSTSNSTATQALPLTTTITGTATVTNAKQASGQLPNLTPVFKFQGNRKKSVAQKKHR